MCVVWGGVSGTDHFSGVWGWGECVKGSCATGSFPSLTVRDDRLDLVCPKEGEEAHCRQDWLADKLNGARPSDDVGEDEGRTDEDGGEMAGTANT